MGPNNLLRFKKESPRVSAGDFPALLSTGCTDRIPPGRSPRDATQSPPGSPVVQTRNEGDPVGGLFPCVRVWGPSGPWLIKVQERDPWSLHPASCSSWPEARKMCYDKCLFQMRPQWLDHEISRWWYQRMITRRGDGWGQRMQGSIQSLSVDSGVPAGGWGLTPAAVVWGWKKNRGENSS